MRKTTLALLACALLGMGLLAGCGGGEDDGGGTSGGTAPADAGGDGGSYKIGGLLTLSGPAALLGQHELDGATVAIREINGAGGVNGRRLELDTTDTAGNANSAVAAFNRLTDDDELIAVFGATFGTETLAISPLARRAEIPMIVPNTLAEGIPDNPWIFLVAYTNAIEADVAREWLLDKGLTRAAILHTTDQYGEDGARFLREMDGIEIVADESMDSAATDVTSQLTKIRSARPDALLVWGTAPNTGIAIKNAGQLGIDVPILSGVAAHSPGNIEAAGGSRALDDWFVQAVMDPNAPLPRQEAGNEALRAAYDYAPDVFSTVGYDAMHILADALERAGADADRASLRDALEQTTELEGLAGTYTFSPESNVGLGPDSILWLGVRDGDFGRADD